MHTRLIEKLEKIPIEILIQFPILKIVVDKTKELANTNLSTREIEKIIIASEEYQELIKISDQISEASNKYLDEHNEDNNAESNEINILMKLDSFALAIYMGKTPSEHEYYEELQVTNTRPFIELGYKISFFTLAKELVNFGIILNLDRPIPVSILIHLINGTTMVDNLEIAKILFDNKERVLLYMDEFEAKYGFNSK